MRKGRQSTQILSRFVCGGEDSNRLVVGEEVGLREDVSEVKRLSMSESRWAGSSSEGIRN